MDHFANSNQEQHDADLRRAARNLIRQQGEAPPALRAAYLREQHRQDPERYQRTVQRHAGEVAWSPAQEADMQSADRQVGWTRSALSMATSGASESAIGAREAAGEGKVLRAGWQAAQGGAQVALTAPGAARAVLTRGLPKLRAALGLMRP